MSYTPPPPPPPPLPQHQPPMQFAPLPPVPGAPAPLPARSLIRRWWWVGLIILTLPVLFACGICYIVWTSIEHSDAMKTFSSQITGSEFAEVGTVKKVSLAARMPMTLHTFSSFNGSKSGTAMFVTLVEGTNGTRFVAVQMELKSGNKNWEVLGYKIEPPDPK